MKSLPSHSLIGGITTESLDFWCQECGAHIYGFRFHSQDIVGV
jgi:hypothetical protein